MHKALFTESAPGHLVEITVRNRKDFAFVPNPLPTDWRFDDHLWPLLVEARAALGKLDGIGRTLPDPELLVRPLKNREAIESSKIEGTFVTAEKLLLYELDPREPSSVEGEVADWNEVFNYSKALAAGCKSLEDLPLCGRLLRDMHGTLMNGVRGRDKQPGEFRSRQNQIGSNGRYIPPPPQEVAGLMSNLDEYINGTGASTDPLIRCFIAHYQFEAIHPFEDGNGRVGRLLLSLMIYQRLNHFMPWLYLSAYFEQFRDEYVDRMFRVSTHGDWSGWIEFCLRGTTEQANDAATRCDKFKTLHDEYYAMEVDHSPRTHKIIEGLFSWPVIQIARLARELDVDYNTAKADIQSLVDAGILEILDDTRPKAYYAPRIMRVAYGESID